MSNYCFECANYQGGENCKSPHCVAVPKEEDNGLGCSYYIPKQSQQIRQFDSGATRDQDLDKYDFEGFLSPIVLNRFGQYMHKHRKQSDGQLRDSDNWQKGIPLKEYMKSGWRHFFDWWLEHRGLKSREGAEDALCGLMFNTMGYLYEILKEKNKEIDRTKPVPGGY